MSGCPRWAVAADGVGPVSGLACDRHPFVLRGPRLPPKDPHKHRSADEHVPGRCEARNPNLLAVAQLLSCRRPRQRRRVFLHRDRPRPPSPWQGATRQAGNRNSFLRAQRQAGYRREVEPSRVVVDGIASYASIRPQVGLGCSVRAGRCSVGAVGLMADRRRASGRDGRAARGGQPGPRIESGVLARAPARRRNGVPHLGHLAAYQGAVLRHGASASSAAAV